MSAHPIKILVVDDDPVLCRGIGVALSTDGSVVRCESDSTHAVESAAMFQPDIVLLDVTMPGMDGWQVLQGLRRQSQTAKTPVIMLTALEADADKVKGFALGSDDYVTKPFNLQVLKARIAAVLRRTVPARNEEPERIPVVLGSRFEFVSTADVCYVEGIRNYSYVHTHQARYLSRLHLGALETRAISGFMRVHRSYIVNLSRVNGYGWASKSSYRLTMDDADKTEVPVSRALVSEVQRRLGIKD